MLEVIINRYEVNCTTKNRIYTEYYAEKKNQRRCLSEKVRYVVSLSCLTTAKENFQIKINFFKQTRPHE